MTTKVRQCRKHGTVLPDGTKVGHHWIIEPVISVETRKDGTERKVTRMYGTCKHCGKVKRFYANPKVLVTG